MSKKQRLIVDKKFKIPRVIKRSAVEILAGNPSRLLNAFEPDLPAFLSYLGGTVEDGRLSARFKTLYPIEIYGPLNIQVDLTGDPATVDILLEVKGGNRSRERARRNIQQLNLNLKFFQEEPMISVMLSYIRGYSPSMSMLHKRAIQILKRQAKPICEAAWSESSIAA
ncbi:MAG: hypothetical protein EBT18_04430 [Gammaproteobacteria bacterium]|nr:hypothetical protein [Gammaproteobacteria bacterium]